MAKRKNYKQSAPKGSTRRLLGVWARAMEINQVSAILP
jgi:hypothetical protein